MRIIIFYATLLFAVSLAWTQDDTIPKKRLRAPAAATGLVGGESHLSYVIRAEKGQTMSVEISWQRTTDNQAQFMVSESPNFFDSSHVNPGGHSACTSLHAWNQCRDRHPVE